MPKYIVKDTTIIHGRKGDKKAARYETGDEIELAEKEADALGGSVEPAPAEPKKAGGK